MTDTTEFLAARTTDGLRAELRALDKKVGSGRATQGEYKLMQTIEAEIERRVLSNDE